MCLNSELLAKCLFSLQDEVLKGQPTQYMDYPVNLVVSSLCYPLGIRPTQLRLKNSSIITLNFTEAENKYGPT